jgi:hypothetical protein
MQARLLHEGLDKTYAVILDTGDEVNECLLRFAKEQSLSAGHLTAIGAFEHVVLGYFDLEKKEYKRIPLEEQVEVVSLVGDIALSEGRPKLHAHVVVAKADGSAWGGHLLEARVCPTLEVIVTESPVHLQRYTDPATGLALIRL